MNELWAWVSTMGLTIATVEIYVAWRIRRAANRIRSAHREADCSECMTNTLKSEKEAEHVIRRIDLAVARER